MGRKRLFFVAATGALMASASACALLSGVADLQEVDCVEGCASDAARSIPDVNADVAEAQPADAFVPVSPSPLDSAPLPPKDASSCTQEGGERENCGACGHSCLGGACISGLCQPFALVTGQNTPDAILLDATSVYWVNKVPDTGKVLKVAKTGGPPMTIAAMQNNPSSLALDGTFVYWTNFVNNGNVAKAPVSASGFVIVLASNQNQPRSIVVDGATGTAYWTNFGNGTLSQVNLANNASKAIFFGQSGPSGLANDADNLYWTNANDGTVRRGTRQQNVSTVGSGKGIPLRLVVDTTSAFWTTATGVSVLTAPLPSGATVTLASGLIANAWGIALSGPDVYFTANGPNGAVLKVPRAGGAVTTVASQQAGPNSVAIDEKAVYWTNSLDGTVMKLAK